MRILPIKFEAGGVENEATVPTTIAAMFLQSYQQNIHVFPNWPTDQDASFGDLLAVGDILVSSSISNGKVTEVSIMSEHGGECNLANPWGPDQAVKVKDYRAEPPKRCAWSCVDRGDANGRDADILADRELEPFQSWCTQHWRNRRFPTARDRWHPNLMGEVMLKPPRSFLLRDQRTNLST